MPITDEDLIDCYNKWTTKAISNNSWIVDVKEIIEKKYDMTTKNPNRKDALEHNPPEQLVGSILEKEREIQAILEEMQDMLTQ
jgi:type I restriction enzyme M protein